MRILIVGAGISGLALAKALDQRDLKYDLVDSAFDHAPSGMGIYLPGNATRGLERLGVLDNIMVDAVRIRRQKIYDSHGRLLNDVYVDEVWSGCGPCLSLPRSTLRSALSSNLTNAVVIQPRKFIGVKPEFGTNRVTFSDRSTQHYDLIVGADGIRSQVRKVAYENSTVKYLGNVCWRFITDNTAKIDCWTAMIGDQRTILAIPISNDKIYVYADCVASSDFHRGTTPVESLKALFSDFDVPFRAIVQALDPSHGVHVGRIEEVTRNSPTMENVMLIGDAAHACSPSMAQGAGMGIEDALVLAEVLQYAPDLRTVSRDFHTRRDPRVDWVQSQCHARDRLRTMPRVLRNLILRYFGTSLYSRSYGLLLKEI